MKFKIVGAAVLIYFLLFSTAFSAKMDILNSSDYTNILTNGANHLVLFQNATIFRRSKTRLKITKKFYNFKWGKTFVPNRFSLNLQNFQMDNGYSVELSRKLKNFNISLGYPFMYKLSYDLNGLKFLYRYTEHPVSFDISTVTLPIAPDFSLVEHKAGIKYRKIIEITEYKFNNHKNQGKFFTDIDGNMFYTALHTSISKIDFTGNALIGNVSLIIAGDSRIIDLNDGNIFFLNNSIKLKAALNPIAGAVFGHITASGTMDLRDYINTNGFFLLERIIKQYGQPFDFKYDMYLSSVYGSIAQGAKLTKYWSFFAKMDLNNLNFSSVGLIKNEKENIDFTFPYKSILFYKIFVKFIYANKKLRVSFFITQYIPLYSEQVRQNRSSDNSFNTGSNKIFGGNSSGVQLAYVF